MKALKRSFQTGLPIFIVSGLFTSFLGLFFYWYKPPLLEMIDLRAGDARFVFRGDSNPGGEVVIVAVDERSVNELGRWPWPRRVMARLVNSLSAAKVTALDMVFSEIVDEEGDMLLGEAVEGSGNVVLGYFFRVSNEPVEVGAPARLEDSRIKLIKVLEEIDTVPLFDYPAVEANIEVVARGADGLGSFNIWPDDDGVYRKAQLINLFNGGFYPSLSLESLRHYLDGEIVMEVASYGVNGLYIKDYMVPVDEGGEFTLNYYGNGGTIRTYSAVDVLRGRVPGEMIKGKLVFVGVTETAVYDIRPTPLDPVFPGVEVHATIAANVLQKRFLVHDNRVVMLDIAFILFLSLAVAVSVAKLHRTLASLAIFILSISFYLLVNFYLFIGYNLVLTVVYPLLSITITYVSLEAYRNLVVESRSRYLKKAFDTYVSPSVVSQLLKDPDKLKLGGEKRDVSILFSDIRGFTSLSERLTPERLVGLLNEYLNPMTEIVLEERGTLDKYIGDAIMVIFNAPLDLPDHPVRACRVALKMVERLRRLNDVWSSNDYPHIAIGIGISAGDAVIGNMGADLRFDYTAIGDTVNLASRLEGMNKLYGTSIIVSEAVRRYAPGDFVFRELDMVKVKGKQTPVTIYELMSRTPGDPVLSWVSERFSEAFCLYKGRRFEEAINVFEAILERVPDDAPSRLYIQRCNAFIQSPPCDGWDGVYVAGSK